MKKLPLPTNELGRLAALESYSIMDSLPEKEYDAIVELASLICGTSIALVSLVDQDRQWFKSSIGLSANQIPRDIAFCQYTILGDDVYEVTNALENELFANNPLVTGNPDIRFYAGAPLKDSNGFNLGTLCVIDTTPRTLTDKQKDALRLLSNQVVNLLQLRRKNTMLVEAQKEFRNIFDLSKDLVSIANIDGLFYQVNPAFTTVLGYSKEELEGKPFFDLVHSDDLEETYKEVEKLAKGEKTLKFINRYRCKNGSYVVLSWNASPDPLTGKLYSIARDITGARDQQELLFKTSADLKAILESAEFSIIASDLNGKVTHFNKGAEILLGYKAEEIIGNRFPEKIHVSDEVIKYTKELSIELGRNVKPTMGDFVVKSCESEQNYPREWTYNKKDGSSINVIVSLSSIINIHGDKMGFLGIGKDITKQKEVELNLINSNKLLDEAETIAKTGSWKFDSLTRGLAWSKGNYSITGIDYLPEKELFEAFKGMLTSEDLALLEKAIEKSLATGKNFEFQCALYLSENKVKYILLLGKLIKNGLGAVIGAHGSTQDITEKVLVEQKLIETHKLLDDSENIAETGSWKFNALTKRLMLSKGHRHTFELAGVPSEELYSTYRNRIHPDDLVKLDERDEIVMKTGEDYKTTYRLLFPNNRIKNISEIGRPFKNKKGEIIGLQGYVQNITEKTIIEKNIAEKSKEVNDIRAALDESSIVTIIDKDGVITYANDNFCSISKFSREELIGQSHSVEEPLYVLNSFIKNIWSIIAIGNIWKGGLKNRAKDGSFYWMDCTIVPFLDNEGKPYQYIAISSDITEEKFAKEKLDSVLVQLEKNNKELDQFANIISHDLKAPLRAIYTLSEWIVADMPEMPARVNDNFDLLRGRVQRMENLINGVLDYSRIGRIKIQRESIDVKQMLDEIVKTLVPNNGFEISIKGDFPVIIGAKILLYQVFSNLISNVVKYNDKPLGKIECYYESIPGFHQFSVKDNGPGIAQKYQKKVFQVFQTIEARDKKESTGIGLSIVHKIIEEEAGTIKIESEENEGANFIFTLPNIVDNKGDGY
ncbi:PAS domain S-box protein [Flavobacterium sp. W22_SRS_FP1]|uniref:PAS domain S-box protein n=1 Tax=Flavobacterium sp. W22_SRS_FP1 TaxID=3240276 RepID=UPI003F901667